LLTKEELARLAKARGIRLWQEEKRYVQALVMYALRNWPIVMKGGTYLWFFHGLNRFSDDLDFTQLGPIEESVEDLKLTLELFGAKNSVKILKDDDYVLMFRASVRGPLYTSEEDLCRVRVEISKRERVSLKPLSVKLDEPYYGIPIVFLRGMDLKEVLAEKIRAAVVRGSARDLYDAWFLIRRGISIDRSLLAQKLMFYGLEMDQSISLRLERIKARWNSELEPVVFGVVPDFQEALEVVKTALAV